MKAALVIVVTLRATPLLLTSKEGEVEVEVVVVGVGVTVVVGVVMVEESSTIGLATSGDPELTLMAAADGGMKESAGLPTDLRLKEMALMLDFCTRS